MLAAQTQQSAQPVTLMASSPTKVTPTAHVGWSDAAQPADAIRQILADHDPSGAGIAFVFVSSHHDLDATAQALRDHLPCPVIACTTAGEITSTHGYKQHGIALATLHGVQAAVTTLGPLNRFSPTDARACVQSLGAHCAIDSNTVALTVLDGLSMLEERVTSHLNAALQGPQLVGGSAGDNLRFKATQVYDGQRFVTGSGLLALIHAPAGVTPYVHHHFTPSSRTLVITQADLGTRTIREINGIPAAQAYADALNVQRGDLTPEFYAAHPLIITTPKGNFVRGIRDIHDDGSMPLYCAIGEGVVVRLGDAGHLGSDTQAMLGTKTFSNATLVLGFDCIQRRIEAQGRGMVHELDHAVAQHNFVGFSTYGEQYAGLHINQTITGLAFQGAAR